MNGDRLLSWVLGCAAALVAAAAIHREFLAAPPDSRLEQSLKPVYVKNWKDYREVGIPSGNSNAKIEIIEFADFECPFCRQYESTLRAVERKYGSTISRTFIHYPLNLHRFAWQAARVAECGAEQGAFAETRDALFAKQDSFGLKPWPSFGKDAGARDQRAFDRCMTRTDTVRRIQQGFALARKEGIEATPTILVNGWQFRGGPPDTVLTQTIDDLLDGRKPRNAR